MLSKNIQKALNDQIAKENHASNYYLAMASWCETKGYWGSAKFLYGHAEDERAHMMKLFHYVNDAGGHALVPKTDGVPESYKNLAEVFQLVFENELKVTKAINELVEQCLAAKDHSSFNFLQWYVAEQHEEERIFKHILDMIKIIAVDEKGYYFIDKEIGKLSKTMSDGEKSAGA
jgi:ferritin